MSSRLFQKKKKILKQFTGRCGSDTALSLLFVIYSFDKQSILINTPFAYSTLHLPVCKCLPNIATAGLKILHREEIPAPDGWTNSSSETSHTTHRIILKHLTKHRHILGVQNTGTRRTDFLQTDSAWKGKAALAELMITGQNSKTLSFYFHPIILSWEKVHLFLNKWSVRHATKACN